MRDSTHTTVDVLIAGAGPVGLTMACELAKRGISYRLIEKAAAPATASRALGIHARTLEIFQKMGIVERFLQAGSTVDGVCLYDGEQVILELMLQGNLSNTPYAFLLIVPQQETERLLTEYLKELGGHVERQRNLIGIQADAAGVIAVIKDEHDGSTEQIRAKWLIGCDGAHSIVRHLMNIPFEGKTLDMAFILADLMMDWDKTRTRTHGWLHEEGVFAAFPLPDGQWRIFADVTPKGDHVAPQATLELLRYLMAERTGDRHTILSNPSWLSTFSINQRMVQQYCSDRVFLAGDAAHIHSPFGGQGMNTGIQDVYNLAWKLDLVLHDQAAPGLLDSYQEERIPVARQVLAQTGTGTGLLVTKNPVLRFLRDTIVLPSVAHSFLMDKFLYEVSELKINYRDSALSRTQFTDNLPLHPGPRAGDRAPQASCTLYPALQTINLFQVIQGTAGHLFLLTGVIINESTLLTLRDLALKIEAMFGDQLQTHIVVYGSKNPAELQDYQGSLLLDVDRSLHTNYGVKRAEMLYIRPDGYIGLRSQRIDEGALLAYLSKIYTVREAAPTPVAV